MVIALFAILAPLLVALLGYQWLNAAVSLDYARQEQQHQRDRVLLLRSLLEHTAMRLSRDDLVRLVRQDFAEKHLIKESNDRVEVDDIVFKLRNNVVTGVAFLGDENRSDSSEEGRQPPR
jgi:hypothetical protein